MISGKYFKMSSSTKTFLALGNWSSKEARNEFKRAMIDAQVSEEAARRAALRSKTSKDKVAE